MAKAKKKATRKKKSSPKKAAKKTTKKSSKKKSGQRELDGMALGSATTVYPNQYDPKLLEAFPNRHPKNDAWTSLICTEFTSLCPKTGQPDFAKIFINYIADKKMVESKSLKLYLFSFRNQGDFHEDCIQNICDELVKLLSPKYLEVIGEFTPRGGIAIFPMASYHNGDDTFEDLWEERMEEYAPGKYSMDLARLY
ncbi:MAG: preQ(1) synthase [Halobacteriovoraceae bacterium]|nr:preQ(1) synthase [Halobacteriovoraceae bacterium]MBT5093671.1 preQ(1) synthase [Halobacteriovoraceae bacterium]